MGQSETIECNVFPMEDERAEYFVELRSAFCLPLSSIQQRIYFYLTCD